MHKRIMGTTRRAAREGLATPCYLIRETGLLRNLERLARVREASGAKCLLALKCFAAWPVFGLMRKYMDGVTTSSPYEVRLGREKFGGEVHAYSVAWRADEMAQVRRLADKVIFNSVSQLDALADRVLGLPLGLRVNPGISHSGFDLADPARRYSRLGVTDRREVERALPRLSGLMFHFNCENEDFGEFDRALDAIGRRYGAIMKRLDWISLGGGLQFTAARYPLRAFAARLKRFAGEFGVQVYLEPGEAAIGGAAELITTVLDVVHNETDVAIVDASTEAHMLDLLIYRTPAPVLGAGRGRHRTQLAGRSCLAGDVFGEAVFPRRLRPGDRVRFGNAAGYTMVKKNWFNGLPMPAIAVERLDGTLEIVRRFGYRDYVRAMG